MYIGLSTRLMESVSIAVLAFSIYLFSAVSNSFSTSYIIDKVIGHVLETVLSFLSDH